METRRSVRCWVAPSSSSENADRQNVQTNRFVAYLPPSAALAGPDQLEVAGLPRVEVAEAGDPLLQLLEELRLFRAEIGGLVGIIHDVVELEAAFAGSTNVTAIANDMMTANMLFFLDCIVSLPMRLF